MVSLLIKKIEDSVGKICEIVLKNGWLIHCKILECDEIYLEILDLRKDTLRIIDVDNIVGLEVKE